jgi:hypothetical protein
VSIHSCHATHASSVDESVSLAAYQAFKYLRPPRITSNDLLAGNAWQIEFQGHVKNDSSGFVDNNAFFSLRSFIPSQQINKSHV